MTATVQPCISETIAVAATGRPDWDPAEIERAVLSAKAAVSPGRLLMEVVRLMQIDESEPRDLDAAVANPFSRNWNPKKKRDRG